MKVAVTGAAGKTGGLVLKKLLERRQQFEPLAIVRNSKSREDLIKNGLRESAVTTVDISTAATADVAAALTGCEAMIIATSAVPQLVPWSLIKVFWAKVTQQQGVGPDFTWKGDQTPETVDWLGQKVQIDAAKQAGVRHVVLVSSMGGTDPKNYLNKLGNGNILLWKRKAEQYLIQSGLEYTIIHPGGLKDQEGGQLQVVLAVDDTLLERKARSIPRADVAELCVQSLTLKEAKNRSVDCVCLPAGEGQATTDWAALFTEMPKNCDYSINSQWETVSATV